MDKIQNKRIIQKRVIELRDSGKTFEQVAETMAEEGMPIGKSTANNYYREAKSYPPRHPNTVIFD